MSFSPSPPTPRAEPLSLTSFMAGVDSTKPCELATEQKITGVFTALDLRHQSLATERYEIAVRHGLLLELAPFEILHDAPNRVGGIVLLLPQADLTPLNLFPRIEEAQAALDHLFKNCGQACAWEAAGVPGTLCLVATQGTVTETSRAAAIAAATGRPAGHSLAFAGYLQLTETR